MTDEPTLGDATLRWLGALCGTDRIHIRGPLLGGAFGRTWAVTVGGASEPSIALKEFPRERHGHYSEEACAGEAFALSIGLPRAPSLLGADSRGVEADEPVVAMEWLAGSARLAPPGDVDDWLKPMAALLAEVHRTETSGARLPLRPNKELSSDIASKVPAWATDDVAWRRVFARVQEARPPDVEGVLIHSDYHPGNVLWVGDEIRGLIDWTWAAIGSPELDLAHCRAGLALLEGVPVAERFLQLYRELRPGSDDWQWWYDARGAALVFLPDPLDMWYWHAFGRPDLTREVMRERLEAFVLGAGQSSSSGTGS